MSGAPTCAFFLLPFGGSIFGKSAMSAAKKSMTTPRKIHPSHQAPNHRESVLSMTGVIRGSMYKLKQPKPNTKPSAGPNVRSARVKPENENVNLNTILVTLKQRIKQKDLNLH